MKSFIIFLLALQTAIITAQEAMSEKLEPQSLETLCLQRLLAHEQKQDILQLLTLPVSPEILPKLIACCLAYVQLRDSNKTASLITSILSLNNPTHDLYLPTKIITALIMHPRLSKEIKLEFLESLTQAAKNSNNPCPQNDPRFTVIAFLKRLLSEENVINIEGSMIKRFLYTPMIKEAGVLFLTRQNPWYTNLKMTDLIYCSPLTTEAVIQRCLPLFRVLVMLGAHLHEKDAIEDNETVTTSKRNGVVKIDPPSMSALDHAIYTLDSELVTGILEFWKDKNLPKAEPKKFLNAILNSFGNGWDPLPINSIMNLLHKQELLDLDVTMNELLLDPCYRKILLPIFNWLFEQKTPILAKSLEAAFINEYQEKADDSLLPLIVPQFIKRYGSIKQLPGDYDKRLKAACAVVVNDTTYLASLSSKELAKSLSGGGETTFHLCHLAAFYGNVEALNILIEKNGTCLLYQDNLDDVPLHLACENGHMNAVTALINLDAQGINVGLNVLNIAQYTPYDSAIIGEQSDLMAFLKAYGAPKNYFIEETDVDGFGHIDDHSDSQKSENEFGYEGDESDNENDDIIKEQSLKKGNAKSESQEQNSKEIPQELRGNNNASECHYESDKEDTCPDRMPWLLSNLDDLV